MTIRRMASVYEFTDRIIVMADHRTDVGLWRAGEPVIRLAISAVPEEFGAAILRALADAPSVVRATPWKEYAVVRAALAKSAGFRSWGSFDRRARLCSVRESESGTLSVMPMRHGGTRGADKGFHERAELAFTIDLVTPTEIGAAARHGLELSLGPA